MAVGALVVGTAALFLFFSRGKSATPVRAAKVERGSLVSNLTTNGRVEPLAPRELRASSAGLVRKVLVKEGDVVKMGQRLVQLEREEAAAEAARAQAELQAAQAALENTERGGSSAELHELESQIQKALAERDEAARQLATSERLLQRNAIPRLDVEQDRERLRKAEQQLAFLEQRRSRRYAPQDRRQARARVSEAQAALALASTRLAATAVTAPASGTLYSLAVQPGNFVNRGELIGRIGDLRRVRVRVFVDEPELGRLARNQEVIVTWDAYPGVSWKGTVERLPARVTTEGTRSVGQVDCAIDNADGRLLPNVNVNVEIITSERPDTLIVPREAVFHESRQMGQKGDRHFVFVVEGNRLRRREVTIGISNATRIEIRSGLQAGELLALATDHKLEDGMRVKISEETSQ